MSCLIFKKKKNFVSKVTWMTMLPDFLLPLMPIAAGIILLIINFSWLILAAVILLFLLMTAGNAVSHGNSCKHCKQRKLGCPAAELFNKRK